MTAVDLLIPHNQLKGYLMNICKAALEYWYSQGLTWEQVDKQLNIKSSKKFRKENNIKTRSRSEINKLVHQNMSKESKEKRHNKMVENHWMKNITEEQEKNRLKKWQNTYNKNKDINIEHNRQAQLKRFSSEQARKDFAEKQKATKIANGSDLGFGSWHKNSTFEQRSLASKKGAETKRRQGNNSWKWPENRKEEILKKQYNTKIKNGTLYTSHGANSKPNLVFKELLDNNSIEYDREIRVGTKFFDFKIGNILIEIDPIATHNSTVGIYGKEPLNENYHIEKTLTAKENGFRCIHIWDWDNLDKIVYLLKDKPTIYARQCVTKEVSKKDSKIFIDKYHLQSYVRSNINIGLYYNDELVSIMTFGKPRYNRNYEYELIRYCYSYNVIGGAEKLFKYFLVNYGPKSIISYCDLSKFSGAIYKKLGFELLTSNIKPSKHWYNSQTKKHITNNLLMARGFDQLFGTNFGKGTSNYDLMIQHKYLELFDCGQCSYIWKKK